MGCRQPAREANGLRAAEGLLFEAIDKTAYPTSPTTSSKAAPLTPPGDSFRVSYKGLSSYESSKEL